MRWLAAVPLVALAGCPAGDDPYLLFDERFEDPAAVQASWLSNLPIVLVPTIHPAEHGLEVSGGQRLSHAISATIWDQWSDGDWLEYSSNCGDAPELWLELNDSDATWVIFASFSADASLAGFDRFHASLPPVPVPATLSAFTLVVESGGSCVIDNLRLMQPANLDGF